VTSVAFTTPLKNNIGNLYLRKRHLCIDLVTLLVSHQAVSLTFYNKIAPMLQWAPFSALPRTLQL